MYKDVLRSIEGIEIFPVIGIVIFFSFFMAWVIYVMALKKRDIDNYSNIPLDFNDQQTVNPLNKNERQ